MKTNLTSIWTASLAAITSIILISVSPAQAGPGDALAFNTNTAGQCVTATIPALANNYTITAWVNLVAGGDYDTLRVGVLSATNCCGSVEVTIQNQSYENLNGQYLMLGRCGCFNGACSVNEVPLDEWVHLAVTVASNNLISYFINGAADISWDGTGNDLTLGPNITLADNTIRRFKGTLDEVQIWSRVLSQTEIQTNMNRAPDVADPTLAAYWSFNDNAGTTATNGATATGSACDGTLVNSPTWVLSTVPFVPDATTGVVTGVGPNVATLNGTVNPCNRPTTALFQWGTDTNYGNFTSAESLSATNAGVGVSIAASNLAGGVTYHFQLMASNSAAVTFTLGGDKSFTTALGGPSAVTLPASGFGAGSATLNGIVYPGVAATAYFQWGTDTNYGNTTSPTNVGSGVAPVPVSTGLTGLLPGTTYHYLMAASNSVGLGTGADMTLQLPAFSTNNAGLPAVEWGSVAWGDYDNDGRLDILLTGGLEQHDTNGYQIPITRVYHNNGDGTFTWNTNAVLPGVWVSSVAWGDYDNDGRLDILLSGGLEQCDTNGNNIPITRVYHNNGDGTFTWNTNAVLPGVYYSSVSWGDYDNDGRLDILLTGYTAQYDTNGDQITISRVYHNNGDGTFTWNTNAVLPGVWGGSVAWGDYDNDGRLDVLLTGATAQNDPDGLAIGISQLYHNDGGGVFSLNTNAVLPGVWDSSVAWGDYDNDGRLDILLTGYYNAGANLYPVSGVYHNNGDGTFTSDANAALMNVFLGSVAWGDYNNDGRLDILLTGATAQVDTNWNSIPIDCVYDNLAVVTNTSPTAPTGLTATVSNNWVTLAWAAGSDLQTPAGGLTYNLRVGSAPGGSDLLSPESDPATGLRRLPQMGNGQGGTQAILNLSSFPGGATCYWSVQTVDSAWAGSPFAVEGSFAVPSHQALRITGCSLTAAGQFQFQFTCGVGTNCTVLCSTNLALPLSNWMPVGAVTNIAAGQYQFTDPGTKTNQRQRFYLLRQP